MIITTLHDIELKSKFKDDRGYWIHQICYGDIVIRYKNRKKKTGNSYYPAFHVSSNAPTIHGRSGFKKEMYKMIPKELYLEVQSVHFKKLCECEQGYQSPL